MTDKTALIIVISIVITICLIIYRVDRRVNEKGGLFTQPASPVMRIFAFLLGLLFGAIFLVEFFSAESIHPAFPLISIALFAYSFGAGKLLMKLQEGHQTIEQQERINSPWPRRVLRLLLILMTGIVGIVAVFYGCLWVLGNPTAGFPFLIALVIGVFVIGLLHYGVVLLEIYKKVK